MTDARPRERREPRFELSGEMLAWVVAAAGFLLLRVAVTWQAPVGSEELPSLSGAWQAASGEGDARFIPTLFQALAALLLDIRDSEVLPRVAAFIATATVPVAMFLLRPVFGTVPVLLALVLAGFDGTGIYIGVAATPSGFDLALLAWGFTLAARDDLRARLPLPAWVAIGLLVSTAGALVLPLLFALAVVAARSRQLQPSPRVTAAIAGAAAGLVLANLGFGYGWDGLVLPPVTGFVDAFDGPSTSLTAAEMVIVYTWPLLLAALAGAFLLERHARTVGHFEGHEILLLAWAGFAVAWLFASAGEHSTLPVAALSLPASLLAGIAITRALAAIQSADWNLARYAIPAGVLLAVVAFAYVTDWARADSVGSGADIGRVIALVSASLAAFLVAAVERESRPSLLAPALGLGAVVMTVGGVGVGLSATSEPLPSPISPESARVLRELAVEVGEERGGEIAVHPDFTGDILWPFRGTGDLLVATRVPDEAVLLIWPADAPQPEGFAPVEGDWSLAASLASPAESWLRLVRWYTQPNSLSVSHSPVAVYIRSE